MIAILGIIFALAGVIATIFFPEIRCSIGLLADTCAASQKEVELVTQTEAREALAGVKVQVFAKGAPETQYTDSNGYAKVKIFNRGDVRVNLSISGYPAQDFNINLANDQNTVRIIRFTKSGQSEVSSLPALPPVVAPTPSPTTSPIKQTNPQPSLLTYEDNIIKANILGTSFNQWGGLQAGLVIENKTSQDLLIAHDSTNSVVISDSGETSGCNFSGLTNVYRSDSNPSSYTRLQSKQKVTISLYNCTGITASSKAKSFSINMSLVRLNNEQPSPITLAINGISLKR